MTLIAWQATVQDDEGNVIVNPSVTVRRASDDGLADIFDSEGEALDNPYTGSSEGFVQFFAQPGKYTVQGARGGSVTQTWTVDLVPFNENVNALAGLSGSSDQVPVFTGPSTMGLRGITQSSMDTADGRLLKVGDFGVGGAAQYDGGGESLDDLTTGGLFQLTSSAVDAWPGQVSADALLSIQSSSSGTYSSQMGFGRQGTAWFRFQNDTNWTDWQEFYHTGNLVGTVSQSGGGAVIERDSNSDGEYMRLADGTQICWSPELTYVRVTAAVMGAPWTSPATFASGQLAVAIQQFSSTSGDYTGDNRGHFIPIGLRDTSAPQDGSRLEQYVYAVEGSSFNSGDEIRNAYACVTGRWF